jgi:hypothetical protein
MERSLLTGQGAFGGSRSASDRGGDIMIKKIEKRRSFLQGGVGLVLLGAALSACGAAGEESVWEDTVEVSDEPFSTSSQHPRWPAGGTTSRS